MPKTTAPLRFADVLNAPAHEAPATDIAHRAALAAYGEVRKPAQTRQPIDPGGRHHELGGGDGP